MAQIISVLSGKGGAGKSTTTVMLGGALAAAGKRVLLVDCDAGLRSLEIFTGAGSETVYHWGDALDKTCSIADALLHCKGGYSLLPAPDKLPETVRPERFAALLNCFSANFDFILIDGPAGLGRGFRFAAAPAQHILLVSAPDEVSLYACNAAREALSAEGKQSMRLILNHFRYMAVRKSFQKNIDDSIDKTGVRLIGIVPEDNNLCYFGSNGLLPKGNSKGVRAFIRIAGRLEGKNIPLKLNDLL
ncbi:MAG: AAA family ATPase [Clostridia bacterium]|nr:AAA family ATPase [Clostridia bacterium]